jgi:hypothetical protein
MKHLPLISKEDCDPELREWWDGRGFDLAICAYMLNSRFANLGGCELGDDEDYGMFSLGRKT